MKTAALILISYNSENIAEEVYESWIVKLLKVSKGLKACRTKIEVLEYKTLNMLSVICKFRLNQQVLTFLKMFKEFEEGNEIPHINIEATRFDNKFSGIFAIHQFNIEEEKSTTRRMK